MTLDLQSLSTAITDTSGNYQPLSRYPSVWQDLSLRVAGDVTYSDLMQTVTAAVEAKADDAKIIIEPTTIYQPEDDSSHKTITYRITATSHSRTLTDDDLRVMLDHAVDQASSSHKASVV